MVVELALELRAGLAIGLELGRSLRELGGRRFEQGLRFVQRRRALRELGVARFEQRLGFAQRRRSRLELLAVLARYLVQRLLAVLARFLDRGLTRREVA